MAVVDEDNKGDRWLTEARAAGERLVEDSEAVREGVPTKAAEEDEIIVAVVMAREAAVDVDVADVVDVVDVAARKEKLIRPRRRPKIKKRLLLKKYLIRRPENNWMRSSTG
mmetsp:Transcript_28728/g.40069  ORF Transcript_28728/g.40069 Transcript_28728/m.40069 type:complete len:111 (-) Transcript_28728:363-695(-)